MSVIYLDNAATTRVKDEVLQVMEQYFTTFYSNPAAHYGLAAKAKEAIEAARKQVADLIHAKPEEIYFTSGGSESDNWVLQAVERLPHARGKHIIVSAIEHHAILRTCAYLWQNGVNVTYLPVNEDGFVSPDDVRNAIRKDTVLISVMTANNEIGTIQPVAEIGAIAHEQGVLFHTDAVQAFGHEPIDVEAEHIDLLSASGHKLGGPKGIGILYIRNGVDLPPLIHGGAQERGKRAGTSNVPGIVGLGKAAEIAARDLENNNEYEKKLRDYFIQRVLTEIPDTKLNGSNTKRLANNINIQFTGVDGESLLILLDHEGIAASAGSACNAGSNEPSHVLTAIGLSARDAKSSLRFTLSEETTKEELDFVIESLKRVIQDLRSTASITAIA